MTKIVSPAEGANFGGRFDAQIDGFADAPKYALPDGREVKIVWAYDAQTCTGGMGDNQYQFTYTNVVCELVIIAK